MAVISPKSRSIRTPAMSTSSPTRRSTIPATCSTRSWSQGQVQGSLANGLGQALMENAVYDRGAGSSLPARSWITACRARTICRSNCARRCIRCRRPTNPLGVKGTGEAGTTAAIAAVMNAIAHAIPNGAADHMEMPATPAKVWEACQRGDGGEVNLRCRPREAGTQPLLILLQRAGSPAYAGDDNNRSTPAR